MPIRGIVVPTRRVEVLGGEVEVRGLSFEDVSALINHHEPEVFAVYDAVINNVVKAETPEAANEGVIMVLKVAISQFPALVAEAIALAADEPGAVNDVRKWPLDAMLAVAVEVADLTFSSDIDMERLTGTLQALAAKMPGASPDAQGNTRLSKNGGGGSAKSGPISYQ